jgi:hypothetical protein
LSLERAETQPVATITLGEGERNIEAPGLLRLMLVCVGALKLGAETVTCVEEMLIDGGVARTSRIRLLSRSEI